MNMSELFRDNLTVISDDAYHELSAMAKENGVSRDVMLDRLILQAGKQASLHTQEAQDTTQARSRESAWEVERRQLADEAQTNR